MPPTFKLLYGRKGWGAARYRIGRNDHFRFGSSVCKPNLCIVEPICLYLSYLCPAPPHIYRISIGDANEGKGIICHIRRIDDQTQDTFSWIRGAPCQEKGSLIIKAEKCRTSRKLTNGDAANVSFHEFSNLRRVQRRTKRPLLL